MSTVRTQSSISRVSFVSLGCPKNLVDSEKMLGTLASSGFTLVNEDEGADAIIINTCGFLEASKQESLGVIHDAIARKEAGELQRVIVAGCLVQRHRAKMLEWAPGIDAMIGVFDRDHIIDAVLGPPMLRVGNNQNHDGHFEEGLHNPTRSVGGPGNSTPRYWIASNALQAAKDRGVNTVGLTVNGADGKGVGYFEGDDQRFRLTPRHWSYLRVSEGCNQRCAFCTIPSIRGKMRSKPLDHILSEARSLMTDGAFELNLIGQDTTSYGYDIYGRHQGIEASRHQGKQYSGDLVGLLNGLNDVATEFGGGWMRLMYVYPTYFTDEMIDAIASLSNIVKYIDIPLQHITDRLLSSMRRNITRAEQEALLEKLRDRIPGVAIRSTFITGFPGETQDDHDELVSFIDSFQFDMMGVFQYSHEDGTPAGTMDDDPALHVPDEVKAEREAELMLAQQRVAFENAQYVAEQACQFDVLIDRPATGNHDNAGAARFVGRCYHQAPQVDSVTYVHSRTHRAPGELVRCTIVNAVGYDLIARPTDELERVVELPVLGT